MNEVYAAKVEDGVVTQVIVGTAEWAIQRLGGYWVDSGIPVWLGGTWDEVNGFQPPTPPE